MHLNNCLCPLTSGNREDESCFCWDVGQTVAHTSRRLFSSTAGNPVQRISAYTLHIRSHNIYLPHCLLIITWTGITKPTDSVSGFLQVDDLRFTLWINFNQWEKHILNILD